MFKMQDFQALKFNYSHIVSTAALEDHRKNAIPEHILIPDKYSGLKRGYNVEYHIPERAVKPFSEHGILHFAKKCKKPRDLILELSHGFRDLQEVKHSPVCYDRIIVDASGQVYFHGCFHEDATFPLCCTKRYQTCSAPEVLREEMNIDVHKADVFTFAMLVAGIITSRKSCRRRLMNGFICTEEFYDYFDKVFGAELRELLKSCCHNDPAERPNLVDVIAKLESLI